MPDYKDVKPGGLYYSLSSALDKHKDSALQREAEIWERVARRWSKDADQLRKDVLALKTGIVSALQFLTGELIGKPPEIWGIQELIDFLEGEAEDVALVRLQDEVLEETLNEPTVVEWNRAQGALCYVKGPWAYFTTQPLHLQWGSGWASSVAYYADGVGGPHQWSPNIRGHKWEIMKVAFESPALVLPREALLNAAFSVDEINRRQVPWLQSPVSWLGGRLEIWAGATLNEFVQIVRKSGGEVYTKAF